MKLANLPVIIGLFIASAKNCLAENPFLLRELAGSKDTPCGNDGEECCLGGGPACLGYHGCDYSADPPVCTENCGDAGQPCCNVDTCNAPSLYQRGAKSMEVSIAYDHKESCECVCDDGLTFDLSTKTCVPCGAPSQPCCDGNCDLSSTCIEASNLCVSCGDEGQPGCTDNDKPCDAHLVLNEQGLCERCGGNGKPGCTDKEPPCKPGYVLNQGGICSKCGYCDYRYQCDPQSILCSIIENPEGEEEDAADENTYMFDAIKKEDEELLEDRCYRCCEGGCNPGFTCLESGYCDFCGEYDDPCCDGHKCKNGLLCNAMGRCEKCGKNGDPCCDEDKCEAGNVCNGRGRCRRCGTSGNLCCDGDKCDTGYVCSGRGVCDRCGNNNGDPCCDGDKCRGSLQCNARGFCRSGA